MPFHQAAVAGDHPGAVVDQVVAEARRSDDARPSPCRPPSRSPGPAGRWSSRRPASSKFSGMAGAGAAELAEVADVVHASAAHSRSGAAARRSASSHGRPTARSGRGRASRAAAGSNLRKRVNSTVAASAMPIGMPGWPELAASTASIASARIALASISGVAAMIGRGFLLGARARGSFVVCGRSRQHPRLPACRAIPQMPIP